MTSLIRLHPTPLKGPVNYPITDQALTPNGHQIQVACSLFLGEMIAKLERC